ncbi:MAG: DedA family protein [Pyrinomonadaceae bacterium]
MSLSEYLLSTLGIYGLPVLFGVLLVGSIGVPMPASLMLIAAGSFVQQGEMNGWSVLALAGAGAILGDNVGYALGRWGGRRLSKRMSRWVGGEARLQYAEDWLMRWGGAGIFLSRWLLTPLGPPINFTSGLAGYPWPRFLLFDLAGEALWVVLYVMLGKIFSDRVQAMSEFLGDFTWMIVGLIAVVTLGWKLRQYFRAPDSVKVKEATRGKLVDETP